MKRTIRFITASSLLLIGLFHNQFALPLPAFWSVWSVLLTAWLMVELLLQTCTAPRSWRDEARSARPAQPAEESQDTSPSLAA